MTLLLVIGSFNLILYLKVHYGFYERMASLSFKQFRWPLDIDLKRVVSLHLRNEPVTTPSLKEQVTFEIILEKQDICREFSGKRTSVLLAVKSSVVNFHRRTAIRNTWGKTDLINPPHGTYTSINNTYPIETKTVFFLGAQNDSAIMANTEEEYLKNKDLVQARFEDKYTHNTYKSIMTFQWISKHCSSADYVFFLDDDIYVSKPNLGKYLSSLSPSSRRELYTGHLSFPRPVRDRTHKLYLSLEDYEFDRVPQNIYAGAFLMSMDYVLPVSIAMHYTKFFRLDDVYLGIIALKLGLKLTDNPLFASHWSSTRREGDYKYVIAAHGIKDICFLYKLFESEK